MSQQDRYREQYAKAERQIAALLLEREEINMRANTLMVLLGQCVKTFGGDEKIIRLKKADLDTFDAELEGVNLQVGEENVEIKLTTRIAESMPKPDDAEPECNCGGNASLEAAHTEECPWWKKHKASPRAAGDPADHKRCGIHSILYPIGTACPKCMDEATAQVPCECSVDDDHVHRKYNHLSGFGKCKLEGCDCTGFRPKLEPQA